jgi:hypothetical protein
MTLAKMWTLRQFESKMHTTSTQVQCAGVRVLHHSRDHMRANGKLGSCKGEFSEGGHGSVGGTNAGATS